MNCFSPVFITSYTDRISEWHRPPAIKTICLDPENAFLLVGLADSRAHFDALIELSRRALPVTDCRFLALMAVPLLLPSMGIGTTLGY